MALGKQRRAEGNPEEPMGTPWAFHACGAHGVGKNGKGRREPRGTHGNTNGFSTRVARMALEKTTRAEGNPWEHNGFSTRAARMKTARAEGNPEEPNGRNPEETRGTACERQGNMCDGTQGNPQEPMAEPILPACYVPIKEVYPASGYTVLV